MKKKSSFGGKKNKQPSPACGPKSPACGENSPRPWSSLKLTVEQALHHGLACLPVLVAAGHAGHGADGRVQRPGALDVGQVRAGAGPKQHPRQVQADVGHRLEQRGPPADASRVHFGTYARHINFPFFKMKRESRGVFLCVNVILFYFIVNIF